ncbi:MAG: DUF1667 domain-containing protein, partial [Anaerotignum sp.]|nr:DUF1667 domain-containing protein [Anaerotignum sp.]
PERVLTVLMRPEGTDRPLSVKTDKPVPKAMLKECAKTIYATHPKLPVKHGDVLITDLCGTLLTSSTLQRRICPFGS